MKVPISLTGGVVRTGTWSQIRNTTPKEVDQKNSEQWAAEALARVLSFALDEMESKQLSVMDAAMRALDNPGCQHQAGIYEQHAGTALTPRALALAMVERLSAQPASAKTKDTATAKALRRGPAHVEKLVEDLDSLHSAAQVIASEAGWAATWEPWSRLDQRIRVGEISKAEAVTLLKMEVMNNVKRSN